MERKVLTSKYKKIETTHIIRGDKIYPARAKHFYSVESFENYPDGKEEVYLFDFFKPVKEDGALVAFVVDLTNDEPLKRFTLKQYFKPFEESIRKQKVPVAEMQKKEFIKKQMDAVKNGEIKSVFHMRSPLPEVGSIYVDMVLIITDGKYLYV